ncbi:oxidoreductase family, NAD-binding Rossmann fold domain protein [Streptomyces himastatinicus ATCC 53653]|uniref:Oxidoreductase family, NAD-binding Rossmann fold domain protein n=1 Tax=Streptomyces himastatinicus ATCC 53653 TaxID=457427 RepID=D9WM58_9ACTN|nr:Gfo/Idh/MocA family oxidoreductase [Streptomyces himastatinicus]EFL25761.1 oxidoreductase family, NAD-binding Rossmann fold domain protein [Streptomyces himastatinicus ATCC 53653]
MDANSRDDSSRDTGTLRAGLIGYGLAGSVFHAPLIAAADGLALDTVVTASPERQQQVRDEHPGVRIAASADELWARAGELDLIVIASPNRTHVPLARAALEAGLPVVVDKPLAATAAEAEELAALAEARGLLLSAFQNRRWDNDFLTLRKLLADGALGEVLRFESRFERWRPQLKGGWRESGDPAEIGGLLYDLGSHLVDQALTLFGPAVSVYAEVDVRRAGAEADDDTFIAITHANGVRSHLWMSAITAQLGPRFRVLGSEAGYVKYGLDPQEAALREGLRPTESGAWGAEPETAWGRLGAGESPLTGGGRPVPTVRGDYPAYYAAIATALRDGTPPPVTAAEAAAALRVLEAARVSATEGRTVRIGGAA